MGIGEWVQGIGCAGRHAKEPRQSPLVSASSPLRQVTRSPSGVLCLGDVPWTAAEAEAEAVIDGRAGIHRNK